MLTDGSVSKSSGATHQHSELQRSIIEGTPYADLEFIRRRSRPNYERGEAKLRIVDLFSGCGAMSLGVAEAAHRMGLGVDIPLAVDTDEDAAKVFKDNFPESEVRLSPVEEIFDGSVTATRRTKSEAAIGEEVGHVDYLLGGPPCQGHSNLNNHTRRKDPRNSLYLRMVRAAKSLKPRVVIIENVPAVVRDTYGAAEETVERLTRLGYDVSHDTITLTEIGVPQRRKRHIVLATWEEELPSARLLQALQAEGHQRTVRWAIEDLKDATTDEGFDAPSRMSPENARRAQLLIDRDEYNLRNSERPECHQGEHSYRSMYGRLSWDEPAQTITTGFGSMGQGRYVHPSAPRTLTPHEAARLQFIPDFHRFSAVSKRTSWAQMIGNAVPPKLTMEIATTIESERLS